MIPENTEKLFMKHPTFFRPELGCHETDMCFGFECGDGWFNLLDNLFDSIATLKPDYGFEVLQVKEKYGGLRVYTSPTSIAIEQLIEAIEDESYRTCEVCGSPGKLRDGSWIVTLCDGCNDQVARA